MNRTLLACSLFFVLSAWIIGCNTDREKEAQQLELPSPDKTDATNDFYDNEVTWPLPLSEIEVGGETEETLTIDLNSLPLHSVIVKETVWTPDSNRFVGAYRYDGPSLYDILNRCPLKKKNADRFNPVIDAYVEISNDKGERVLFSWGEIYYPIHRHEIIIGTRVMQIVPSKTKDYWPLPEEPRMVVASDLLTERNIENPGRITIRSLDREFTVNRDLNPLYSPSVNVYSNNSGIFEIHEMPELAPVTYPNIFYGRGKGIHAVTPFTGVILREILMPHFPVTVDALRTGMFTVAAADGYRAAFTYSEVMNRNDQSEALLVGDGNENGGRFRIYPAADFFSDRAIKAVTGIWYDNL